uniref:Uncharacterized protein n=1 Tax=Oryza brachyantha TaxID=4533 RepID=J3LVR2_ORYBR
MVVATKELEACRVDGNLELGQASCDNTGLDATSAHAGEDDVIVVIEAIVKTATKSPEVVRAFVRRLTPATVARHINWDIICERTNNRADKNIFREGLRGVEDQQGCPDGDPNQVDFKYGSEFRINLH